MNDQTLTPFEMSQLPHGHQVSMSGDDWLSDRDRKTQAKAEAKRKRTALACASKLAAASQALTEYLNACAECNDASSPRHAADGRYSLRSSINEYAAYLSGRYDK